MSMRFTTTKASDAAHKRLTVLVYGESGIGKTSLSKTLNLSSDDKLFYIAADPGQLALRERGFIVAEAPNGEWNEGVLEDIYRYLLTHASEYEWIVVDGLDELGEAVLRDKSKTQRDMRKAYGEMGDFMANWTKKMRDLKGTSSIFITHISKDKDETGAMYFSPSFPGNKVTEQLVDWFDMVGCMRSVKTESAVSRMIQFKPEADLRFKVKDRSGVMNDFESPNLGDIFSRVHEKGFILKEAALRYPTDEDRSALVQRARAAGLTRVDLENAAGAAYDGMTYDTYEKMINFVASKENN